MKRTLTLLTAAAAFAVTAAFAQPGMQNGMHGMHDAQPMQRKHMKQKKGNKKGMKSVFLIQRGLPHYTMILMKLWDDPKLALTPEQKTRLEAVRNRTIAAVQELAPQVKKLRKKIVHAARKGARPETLAADVDRLAVLKAKATKTQLACMYDTRQVLSPEQLRYIEHFLKQKRQKHKKKHRS
ncbi:hypothetical protein [Hydrogenimonas sp.]